MARFSMILALLAASVAFAAPAPIRRADLACSIDRAKILISLATTGIDVKKIDTTNPDTAKAVAAAQQALASAGGGVATIALSLISGGAPPADARTQVQTGLNDAQTALTGINDDTVADSLATAQSSLAASIQDGDDVVKDCV
ncbi:hypothetical protein B0H16DRAFT_1541308 [Mycena metata]|uniref:Cell wall protein n=1 Tax=Mycena metata TaxID=1033252 RepID=A0AAD7J1U2_9AGAR|nr:hypothetical protein B0H16DRAFT_1541308 [Mycena metata]